MNNAKVKKALTYLLKTESKTVRDMNKLLDDKRLYRAINILARTKGKLVITGAGKSGHIANKIVSTMTSLGIPAVFLHPNEAVHGDLGVVSMQDAVIAISYSGQTSEITKLIKYLSKHNISIVVITGNKNSSLATLSSEFICFDVVEEGSPLNLAPMSSATATLIVGDMIATALCLRSGFTEDKFANFHPGGSLGLQLTKTVELMAKGSKMPIVVENASFRKVLREMTKKKIGTTGVVNKKGKLVGIITDGDLRRFLLANNETDKTIALSMMTSDPKVVGAEHSLEKALRVMESYRITSLFVVDKKSKPLGIIHMHQIIEYQIT